MKINDTGFAHLLTAISLEKSCGHNCTFLQKRKQCGLTSTERTHETNIEKKTKTAK